MKKFLKKITIVIIFCIASVYGQNTGKLSGTVIDKTNNEPLYGATILVTGTTLGAATDLKGDYFILNIPPGTYKVTASFVGYTKITQTEVKIFTNQTTKLDFLLSATALQIEEVTVVSQKPKVELDNTSSKETLSREEIVNSWGNEIKDVISELSGTNLHGGIRGSFGNDISYKFDGIDLRDVGSNTNFGSINLSTLQEIQVMTGGWNAEFGQANGAIINLVPRKATDRIHVVATYRTRPAGLYHWGRNFYGGENDPFTTVMTTPEFWNPDTTWQTVWMKYPRQGYSGGSSYFSKMTPEERAEWWKNFVNDKTQFPQIDYANRREWEQEITLFGPILPNLGFMLSGRYKEGVVIYPSPLKYNPDMTFQGSLDWSINPSSKIGLTGIYTEFINSGSPKTYYQSSETTSGDLTGQQLSMITDPYSVYKFWMFGTKGGSDEFTMRPPEKAQFYNIQAKLTHVFSKSSFLEAALQHSLMNYYLNYEDIARSAAFPGFGLPTPNDSIDGFPAYGITPPRSFWNPTYWGVFGDVWRSSAKTASYNIKADFTSQVTKNHLIKTGFVFSYFVLDKVVHEGSSGLPPSSSAFAQVNDIVPIDNKPYEGAFYLQDKIEIGGMVINAGLRFDFFNANKNVSSTIYDPLMISDSTEGHTGPIGSISYRQDGSGPGYTKTPTRYALSPRLGISHPITETTVLHFMFGIFNQRPAWNKIVANPVVWTNKLPANVNSYLELPETTLVTYRYYGQKVGNPALTWEKMTQYEVGFEQNIADLFSLDVTMYYKDAYNLTSLGINQGPATSSIQESGGSVDVRLYGDPYVPDGQVVGKYIRNFMTTVNGAWADVRGLELKLRSRFELINFEFNYNLSYLTNGSYHYNKMFRQFSDGTQLGENIYQGASNTDQGGLGNNDQRWNPNNSAVLKLFIQTPDNFGPSFSGIYPLGGWVLTTATRWSQGEEFTYYPDDYVGERIPLNQTWQGSWNTNLNISKSFNLMNDIKFKLFVQVTNLFNNKNLRYITSATSRNLYMQEGILPFQSTTGEPLEWSWYSNLPRQIFIGTTIEY